MIRLTSGRADKKIGSMQGHKVESSGVYLSDRTKLAALINVRLIFPESGEVLSKDGILRDIFKEQGRREAAAPYFPAGSVLQSSAL